MKLKKMFVIGLFAPLVSTTAGAGTYTVTVDGSAFDKQVTGFSVTKAAGSDNVTINLTTSGTGGTDGGTGGTDGGTGGTDGGTGGTDGGTGGNSCEALTSPYSCDNNFGVISESNWDGTISVPKGAISVSEFTTNNTKDAGRLFFELPTGVQAYTTRAWIAKDPTETFDAAKAKNYKCTAVVSFTATLKYDQGYNVYCPLEYNTKYYLMVEPDSSTIPNGKTAKWWLTVK